jgi:hypothetical protein
VATGSTESTSLLYSLSFASAVSRSSKPSFEEVEGIADESDKHRVRETALQGLHELLPDQTAPQRNSSDRSNEPASERWKANSKHVFPTFSAANTQTKKSPKKRSKGDSETQAEIVGEVQSALRTH